jgi:hypothetical protein
VGQSGVSYFKETVTLRLYDTVDCVASFGVTIELVNLWDFHLDCLNFIIRYLSWVDHVTESIKR